MDYRLIDLIDQNNISTLTSSLNDNNVLITPSNQKFFLFQIMIRKHLMNLVFIKDISKK